MSDQVKKQAVTVEDAFDKRLWESGTLKRGAYTILDITENSLGFSVKTDINTLLKFADDWLDYTPNTPAERPIDTVLLDLRERLATIGELCFNGLNNPNSDALAILAEIDDIVHQEKHV